MEKQEELFCNRCGHTCRVNPGSHGFVENNGLIGARVSGGYFGEFPPDGETWTFHLCEACVVWLVSTFKTFPAASDYTEGDKPMEPLTSHYNAIRKGDVSGLTTYEMATYQRAMTPLAHEQPSPADPRVIAARMGVEMNRIRAREIETGQEYAQLDLFLSNLGIETDDRDTIERLREFVAKLPVAESRWAVASMMRVRELLESRKIDEAKAAIDLLLDEHERRDLVAIVDSHSELLGAASKWADLYEKKLFGESPDEEELASLASRVRYAVSSMRRHLAMREPGATTDESSAPKSDEAPKSITHVLLRALSEIALHLDDGWEKPDEQLAQIAAILAKTFVPKERKQAARRVIAWERIARDAIEFSAAYSRLILASKENPMLLRAATAVSETYGELANSIEYYSHDLREEE